MRIRLQLLPRDGVARIPIQYNSFIQAFIYSHLDPVLSESLHDRGTPVGGRRLKLFTFSRLLGRSAVDQGYIRFMGTVTLVVGSPITALLESLAVAALKDRMFQIGGAIFELVSVEVEQDPPYQERALVRTLSPLTVYSTLTTPNGGRKTYYYSPFEPEFSTLVVRNLARKVQAFHGHTPPLGEGVIRPRQVRSQDQRVLIYKGTVIKGWDGVYEMRLSESLFRMALDAGLGAKNSQGFGCVELWRPRARDTGRSDYAERERPSRGRT